MAYNNSKGNKYTDRKARTAPASSPFTGEDARRAGRGRFYVFNFVSIHPPDFFWNVSSDSIPLAMPRTTKILVLEGL